ncbi:MAG: lipid IV(A) 3-deoxy-D-manno-octulosonic acid transferase [Gammaproteobacteria bacterium]|nr:lipid IV(A) 3-deoxy-D-manno-octulosonic acid transferase [Gammaproteobacteria bacterium]
MRLLYTLSLYLLLPFVLLRLLRRGLRAPAYLRRWPERFGRFPRTPPPGAIWIHAVSVGETIAAFPLVRALQQRHPQRPIIFTTTTPTGSERVTREFGAGVLHGYLPYDLPGAVARFLARTRPALAVILETELWPNMYAACSARGIPLIVANARLSARSAAGYRRVARLARATLEQVTLVAAQGEADAERFLALGASRDRVRVTGNLKFDLAVAPDLGERGQALRDGWGERRPVWIAASTHDGEEALALEAHARARGQIPDLLLLLVPRHPERFDRVAELCRTHGMPVVRRSEQRPCAPDTAVYLGDSMGELMLLYAAADVAFVGGSLVPSGGHNPLEPAALARPVLHGPHVFNFSEICRLLREAGGSREVNDAGELAGAVIDLLRHPEQAADMGKRAHGVVLRNRGALERLLGMIGEMLTTGLSAKD